LILGQATTGEWRIRRLEGWTDTSAGFVLSEPRGDGG